MDRKICSVLILLMSFCGLAEASVVKEVGLEEMTLAASFVFHGKVESVHVEPSANPKDLIYTRTKIRVLDVYQADDEVHSDVLLRLPGGSRDGRKDVVAGMPVFRVGEEVILFLEKTSQGWTPCGLSQGVFRVRMDAETKTRVLSRLHDEVGYARFSREEKFRLTGGPGEVRDLPLESFRREVLLYVPPKKRVAPFREARPQILK